MPRRNCNTAQRTHAAPATHVVVERATGHLIDSGTKRYCMEVAESANQLNGSWLFTTKPIHK